MLPAIICLPAIIILLNINKITWKEQFC